jgi:hypothetical protein
LCEENVDTADVYIPWFLCIPQFIWSLIYLGGFENSHVDGNPSRIEVLELPVTQHLRIPVIMGNKYTAPPTTTAELVGEERLYTVDALQRCGVRVINGRLNDEDARVESVKITASIPGNA